MGGCLSMKIHNNQQSNAMISVVDRTLKRKCDQAERVGEDTYPSFRWAE